MIISNVDSFAKEYLCSGRGCYKRVTVQCVGQRQDACPYVNGVLEKIDDNTIVSFETGTYLVGTAFLLSNRKNVVIEGNNSTFLQNFLSEEYGTESSDIFHIENCEDITLRNFIIETSEPVNVSGIITDTGDDHFDLQVNKNIPFTGKEKYITGYTFSKEGFPTYGLAHPKELDKTTYDMVGGEICCTNPRFPDIPHEKTGASTVRVKSFLREPDGSFLQDIPIEKGMTFCMRYAYYGPVACLFRNTHRVVVEDVRVHSFGGMVFVVLPRCSDFTFNRVAIEPKEPEYQFFSSNADGIHTTGLMGRLTIRDSVFRNLGDDVINVHTQVMRAVAVTEGSMRVRYEKVKEYISPLWAQKGDALHIYDPRTLKRKADVIVKDFKDNMVCFDGGAEVADGDIVVNSAYYPEITIENCVSYNLRDRAYVVQGVRSLTVRNCEFYNVTGAAVYISTAFQKWLEGGPAENVEIYNNLISGCDTWTKNGYAALNIWIRGEYGEDVHNVHKNISIHDNVFENIAGPLVFASMTDKIAVRDNVLHGCRYDEDGIELSGCTECIVDNNISV